MSDVFTMRNSYNGLQIQGIKSNGRYFAYPIEESPSTYKAWMVIDRTTGEQFGPFNTAWEATSYIDTL